jgi:hypothetical protein
MLSKVGRAGNPRKVRGRIPRSSSSFAQRSGRMFKQPVEHRLVTAFPAGVGALGHTSALCSVESGIGLGNYIGRYAELRNKV